jgi:uncharacterized protein YebE (UPF0316 family)
MTKGYRNIAPIIGFFEILIWIVAITRIMQNLNNWVTYVAYAAGFATGNYVGMLLDEKLAIGHELIRVITKIEAKDLADMLRNAGFGVTSVKATGMQGDVGIHYIIVNRKNRKGYGIIELISPNAFYTIENIHFVNRPLDKNIITGSSGDVDSKSKAIIYHSERSRMTNSGYSTTPLSMTYKPNPIINILKIYRSNGYSCLINT